MQYDTVYYKAEACKRQIAFASSVHRHSTSITTRIEERNWCQALHFNEKHNYDWGGRGQRKEPASNQLELGRRSELGQHAKQLRIERPKHLTTTRTGSNEKKFVRSHLFKEGNSGERSDRPQQTRLNRNELTYKLAHLALYCCGLG